MTRPQTPSQTIGPFFGFALPWPQGALVVPAGTPRGIWLRGRVFDGAGKPVTDALVETWQADPEGQFAQHGFRGFGRCATDPQGGFAIYTVKPGRVPGADAGLQAPHVDISIFARGLLDRVVTRLYFPDEVDLNRTDPVLASLDEQARASLIAVATEDGYRLDIRLQGGDQTAFFEL